MSREVCARMVSEWGWSEGGREWGVLLRLMPTPTSA